MAMFHLRPRKRRTAEAAEALIFPQLRRKVANYNKAMMIQASAKGNSTVVAEEEELEESDDDGGLPAVAMPMEEGIKLARPALTSTSTAAAAAM